MPQRAAGRHVPLGMISRRLRAAGVTAAFIAALWGCDERQSCPFPGPLPAPDAERQQVLLGHFRQRVEPDALARGFGVTEFAMVPSTDALGFELTVPEATRVVTCGLFVGKPVFAMDPKRIENAALVLPRVRTYRTRGQETLVLNAGSLRLVGSAEADGGVDWFRCSSLPTEPYYYLVEGLWLGCWASDGVSIVAATELVPLSLSDVPQAQPAVSSCFEQDLTLTADRLCLVDAQLGTCGSGGCEPIIEDAGADSGDGGACPGTACMNAADSQPVTSCSLATLGARCIRVEGNRYGRCRGGFCSPGDDVAGRNFPADQLVVDCSRAPDGFSCEQRELGTFGTCYGRQCRRRCLDTKECMASQVYSGALREQTSCFQEPALSVGVCVRPGESG